MERIAGWALRSPGLARALVTTSSLLPGWIIASAIVLAAGAVATLGTGTPWVALLAPAVAAACLFALAPAWTATRIDLHSALQSSPRGYSGGRLRNRLCGFTNLVA